MRPSLPRGFTLLELIVVIAIVGILSVIILPSFTSALGKATDTKIRQNIINTIKRYDVLAKWEFEEGSGLVAKDTAVNSIDNTPQNNATIPGSGVTYSSNTYASSSQYSLLFDGTSNVVTNNNTYPKLDNSSFSFSLWFRRTGGFGAGIRPLLEKGNNPVSNQWFSIAFLNDQLFVGSYGIDYYTGLYITDQLWHNMMFSFDATTNIGTVYVDSKKVGTYNYTAPFTTTDNFPLRIGYWAGYRFIGNIDDVTYFKDVIVK